jgi:hypothetical protein
MPVFEEVRQRFRDDGLHYVDPDERHLLISMSAIDRPATLKLNRARNLNLDLPAVQ